MGLELSQVFAAAPQKIEASGERLQFSLSPSVAHEAAPVQLIPQKLVASAFTPPVHEPGPPQLTWQIEASHSTGSEAPPPPHESVAPVQMKSQRPDWQATPL